jgi:hypothetical protein
MKNSVVSDQWAPGACKQQGMQKLHNKTPIVKGHSTATV